MNKFFSFILLFASSSVIADVYKCNNVNSYGRYSTDDTVRDFGYQNFLITTSEYLVEFYDFKTGISSDFQVINNNNNLLIAVDINETLQYVEFLKLDKKNNKFVFMSSSFLYGETVYHGFCYK